MSRVKQITADQAAALVHDGQSLATSGYIGAGFPEALVCGLGDRFRRTSQPGNLTLIHAAGQGDWRDRGLGQLAQPGLLRRIIGGYFATSPGLCDLIAEDLVEAYSFPQGVITQLFRNIAAGKPGVFTHVGLGTFVDPRLEGGRANGGTTEELVRVTQLGGREVLFYPAQHLDVAFIRATTADLNGNLSHEREAAPLDHLAIAQATRHCGGIVVAQVERLAQKGSLDPRRVKVPGNLVDYLVVAPPEHHWQTFGEPFNPAYVGDVKTPLVPPASRPPDLDKVLARRAALEIRPGDVVNMYHGPTEALSQVALEEGLLDRIDLTVASGAVGGLPAGGLSYGLALNPEAIIDQPAMFDFYQGGGLDCAVLPMIEVDARGDVNVTRYGRTLKGCGSFVDISQSAKRLVFLGTHTVGAHVELTGGQVVVRREGRAKRFVAAVEQISFSADQARRRGQEVLYVTERAVFRLTDKGLALTELAPGLRLEEDVLAPMSFRPQVDSPQPMDPALFGEAPLGADRWGPAPEKTQNKQLTAREAADLVPDGGVVGTSGFVGAGFAEALAKGLQERFSETGHPRDITLIFCAGIGDGKERGLNRLAQPGLVKRIIGGHVGLTPALGKRILAGEIAFYNLPQGVISHMLRDIAAGLPGTVHHVGLGTYVDPRLEGGKANALCTEDLVELFPWDGDEYLYFHAPERIDVAFIRGTTADEQGNLTMEEEALFIEHLPMAMAAKATGGTTVAQVKRIAQAGSLDPRDVRVPGFLVDHVAIAPPELHPQTFAEDYNPAYLGLIKVPLTSFAPLPMSERKVIARRGLLEIPKHAVTNLGIGMPEGVALTAIEEGIIGDLILSVEAGPTGGIPASGLSFGAAANPWCITEQPSQFDFYDGGGLDVSCLGAAQVDPEGNANVSRFGPKLPGCGGFIDISQNAKRLMFMGTLVAGAKLEVTDTGLRVAQEGRVRKFIKSLEQRTFSAATALARGQSVLYITERCVFRLTPDGLELIEIAPGLDLQRDVLSQLDFTPRLAEPLAQMDPRCFATGLMGLSQP